jgi:2'-5' RNA ligase
VSRLFVAVWPPPPVAAALAALPRPTVEGVRWTTPDQWHVTLRFLGDCDDRDAAAAVAAVEASVTTADAGPTPRRLGRELLVIPVGGLDVLAEAVVAATADIGRPPDPRSFRGHLTLARARRGRRVPAVSAAIDARWKVDEVALVASRTHPHGARYTTVARVMLVG